MEFLRGWDARARPRKTSRGVACHCGATCCTTKIHASRRSTYPRNCRRSCHATGKTSQRYSPAEQSVAQQRRHRGGPPPPTTILAPLGKSDKGGLRFYWNCPLFVGLWPKRPKRSLFLFFFSISSRYLVLIYICFWVVLLRTAVANCKFW